MKKNINIKEWKRLQPYTFFSQFSDPYAEITTTIKIDKLYNYVKKNSMSFYAVMSYFVLQAINSIDEFKYVLEGNNIFKYDYINASFSVLRKDMTLNFTRTVKYSQCLNQFIQDFNQAKYDAENNNNVSYSSEMNKVYLTCIPWMQINGIKNPVNNKNIDSVPRICWGKYYKKNDQMFIDISIQVNHAFQDGYHIGLFIGELEKIIKDYDYEK